MVERFGEGPWGKMGGMFGKKLEDAAQKKRRFLGRVEREKRVITIKGNQNAKVGRNQGR